MDKKNINENAGTNEEKIEEKTSKDKKLFTAEEVNQIVQRRLNRVNEKNEAEKAEELEHENELTARADSVTDREKAIAAKENYLACKEFCMNAAYPVELLEILDTANPEKFMETAEALGRLDGDPFNRSAPLGNNDPSDGYANTPDSFKRAVPHKPRYRNY